MQTVAEFVCDYLPFGDANRLLSCSNKMIEAYSEDHPVWDWIAFRAKLNPSLRPATRHSLKTHLSSSPRSCRQCGILTSMTLTSTRGRHHIPVCKKCSAAKGGYFEIVSRREALSRSSAGRLKHLPIAASEGCPKHQSRRKRLEFSAFYWQFQVRDLTLTERKCSSTKLIGLRRGEEETPP